MARNSGRFHFDGGAIAYIGTGILAVIITVFTFGICYPFGLVLKERWRAKHSYIASAALSGYAPQHSLGAHAALPNGIPQER